MEVQGNRLDVQTRVVWNLSPKWALNARISTSLAQTSSKPLARNRANQPRPIAPPKRGVPEEPPPNGAHNLRARCAVSRPAAATAVRTLDCDL